MIASYDFGNITISGKKYTSDVIIYTDRIDSKWWREEGHSLHPADLKEVIEEKPEIIIIGTGKYGVMQIPKETSAWITSCGIELIAVPTDEACSIFNGLKKTKKVIACLHLTC